MSNRQRIALVVLRWSVGLVVLWQSWRFVISSAAAHHFYRLGLPHWIHPLLGIAEMAAAVFFLIPKWNRAGGYALLAIFSVAGLLHVLRGEFEIGPLVVYAAAVLVCVWM